MFNVSFFMKLKNLLFYYMIAFLANPFPRPIFISINKVLIVLNDIVSKMIPGTKGIIFPTIFIPTLDYFCCTYTVYYNQYNLFLITSVTYSVIITHISSLFMLIGTYSDTYVRLIIHSIFLYIGICGYGN